MDPTVITPLVDRLGLRAAITILVAGAILRWLGRDLAPWVGSRIDSFASWAAPRADRILNTWLTKAAADKTIPTDSATATPTVILPTTTTSTTPKDEPQTSTVK